MSRSVSGDHRDHREQGEHGAAVFPRAAGPSPGTSAAAGTRAVREVERVCARGLAPDALFGALLERLRRAVPFDALCWNATDPGTLLATRVRTESMEGATAAGAVRFFENEYVWEDVAKFSALARATEPVGILSEATAGEPRRSRRYRLINGPMGLDHELRVAFVAGGGCWATASLHRRAGAPDFTRGDAAFLARVSAPVARGLRVGALLGEAAPTGRTAPDAAAAGSEYGSGVLLLDERYELVAATPAAERWLAELPPEFAGDGGAGARRPLPAAVYAAAARGRAAASARSAADAGGDAGAAQQARARVRTRSGFWLLVHAADLTARTPSGEALGAGRTIAVVLEPARPPDVLPLLEQAYGLTARESEVVRQVLSGASSAEIARLLVVSPYTVQDHLKAVFDKVGVRSRRDLVGRFLGEQYFPRLFTDASGTGGMTRAAHWF